ncbi:hypothetical protein [Actinoplanes regularis]|uniref:hypothetical protein n=1 Tax=Actinoplanes regularis TaxID=52697 RepID=UPI002552A5AE|nr:hypothetical protein [Actinoplanes regularis]
MGDGHGVENASYRRDRALSTALLLTGSPAFADDSDTTPPALFSSGLTEGQFNGETVATDTRANYYFAINTAKYCKTIKVQLRAYDKAGNTTISNARVWHR